MTETDCPNCGEDTLVEGTFRSKDVGGFGKREGFLCIGCNILWLPEEIEEEE